jgi:hypothetical protein
MRIRLLAGIFVLAGCPVQQAVDDFFEEFGTQPGESTSTGGESTSNDTSTSTAADGESTRDISGSSADAAEASAGEATSEAADDQQHDERSIEHDGGQLVLRRWHRRRPKRRMR